MCFINWKACTRYSSSGTENMYKVPGLGRFMKLAMLVENGQFPICTLLCWTRSDWCSHNWESYKMFYEDKSLSFLADWYENSEQYIDLFSWIASSVLTLLMQHRLQSLFALSIFHQKIATLDGNWSWSLECLPHIWSWHAFLALHLAGNIWIHLAYETEYCYLTLGYNYTDKVMDVRQGGKGARKAVNWPDLKPCIYKKRWQGACWTPWNQLHILSLQQSGWPNRDKLRFVPFTPMSFIKPLHNRMNLTNGESWVCGLWVMFTVGQSWVGWRVWMHCFVKILGTTLLIFC